MASIGPSSTGHRVLAAVLGAQVAWWQLGFAVRRAVLRDARRGRRFADDDVWDTSVDWARQWLTAPRWSRAIRDGGAVVLAVVCTAALACVMAEVDGVVALSGAVAGCLPLVAGWVLRQGQHARALVRLQPDARPARGSPRIRAVRAVAVLLVTISAATMLIVSVDFERSRRLDCPRFALDQAVRRWWETEGLGCPAGDTSVDASGLRSTPWTVPEQHSPYGQDNVLYLGPAGEPVLILAAIFAVWVAHGGPTGPLGRPLESITDDTTAFQNFDGGSIVVRSPGGPAEALLGQRQPVVRDVGSPCARTDRPCVTSVRAEPGGVRIGWQYGEADAFNVSWWPEHPADRRFTQREAAGYEYVLTDLRPGVAYVVEVAACDKRFLRRSTCTWPSARVLVRAG
ncbi:fibronectin type III domain-containing protein [Actinosynnema sp. NPDC020468]|uniref:fibronectin type III domain-containing protein n=1 Tax=Actinosynnema sp. NPDC020468 TaxID=3154488 RepID=UPI0034021EEA